MTLVLTPVQALAALGLVVDARQAEDGKRVIASAYRDGTVVAVTLRDNYGDAVNALYHSVTAPDGKKKRSR